MEDSAGRGCLCLPSLQPSPSIPLSSQGSLARPVVRSICCVPGTLVHADSPVRWGWGTADLRVTADLDDNLKYQVSKCQSRGLNPHLPDSVWRCCLWLPLPPSPPGL